MKELLAENLMVMMRDLESCAGNDNLISESDIRRSAHTLPVLLAGADFIFSGFGSIPRYDNAFALSNFNSDDMDDFLVLQRDWGVDGGLRTVSAEHLERGPPPRAPRPCRRSTATSAWPTTTTTGSRRWWWPTDPATCRRPSEDGRRGGGLDRGQAADGVRRHRLAAAHRVRPRRPRRSCGSPGSGCAGTSCRPRRSSTTQFRVLSKITDPNDYAGPGNGLRADRASAAPRSTAIRQARSGRRADRRPGRAPRPRHRHRRRDRPAGQRSARGVHRAVARAGVAACG